MGELIPLLLLLVALIPKIKKTQWAKRVEEILNGNMKAPSDLLPEMRPAAVKPVQATPAPLPVRQEMPASASAPRQEAFHSGFESRPEKIVLNEGEGVDPCHDGLYEDEVEEMPQSAAFQEESNGLQDNELIRGIVLGEILTKPKYRQFARK